MTINEAVEQIEDALLEDTDEPGIRDTDDGRLVLTEIGSIRLRRILVEFKEAHKQDKREKKRKRR
jgi:hypothetical protein